MTHRERVLTTLKHQIPDRVPIHAIEIDGFANYAKLIGLEPDYESVLQYFDFDIRSIFPIYIGQDKNRRIGNSFGTSGGAENYSNDTFLRPFAKVEDVKDIESYNWPTTEDYDFSQMPLTAASYKGEYALMASHWSPVFCQVLDFFGMEQAMVNLYEAPKLIEATVERIEYFYLQYNKAIFEALKGKADIFNMGDDFATQRGMMISPELWRRYFKPSIKKIFELAKSYGLYVWFHSCGVIGEVMPDLIEMGMDVWETVQAHLPGNDPEYIKREYGKDITFFGGINTQHTLPYGTPNDVRREVRERIRVLGEGGGYICGPDHHVKVDVPFMNTLAMFDEIKRFRMSGRTL